MTLNLVRRSTKGSPLTAVDHDGNLDKIEQAIEGIEPTPGTDLSYTPSTRLLSSSTGQDATLPLAGTDAGLLAGVSFTGPSGWTASGSVANGTITLGLALPAGSSLVASGDRTAWDTAYAERLRWDGGSTGLNASTARTSLGLGTFAAANAATPPAIGGTTPAAGAFTDLSASASLLLPGAAPSVPAAGHVYRSTNTLRYSDSTGAERLILNAQDNLANLADAAVARSNLGAASTAVVTTSTAGLMPALSFAAITYAADIVLDMAALDGQVRTISLAGNLSPTTINRATGRSVSLRIIADSTQRTFTFPAGWTFGGTKPANIAASKTGVLSLTFFGSADTDCFACWVVQG